MKVYIHSLNSKVVNNDLDVKLSIPVLVINPLEILFDFRSKSSKFGLENFESSTSKLHISFNFHRNSGALLSECKLDDTLVRMETF